MKHTSMSDIALTTEQDDTAYISAPPSGTSLPPVTVPLFPFPCPDQDPAAVNYGVCEHHSQHLLQLPLPVASWDRR